MTAITPARHTNLRNHQHVQAIQNSDLSNKLLLCDKTKEHAFVFKTMYILKRYAMTPKIRIKYERPCYNGLNSTNACTAPVSNKQNLEKS